MFWCSDQSNMTFEDYAFSCWQSKCKMCSSGWSFLHCGHVSFNCIVLSSVQCNALCVLSFNQPYQLPLLLLLLIFFPSNIVLEIWSPVPWSRQDYLVIWPVPVDSFVSVWFKFVLSEWWVSNQHNRHISLAQFTQDNMLATKTLPDELLQYYISASLCFGNYLLGNLFLYLVWL